MIKVKGEKNTEADKKLAKALGLAGNDMARTLGMPSAMPKKEAAPVRENPTIQSVTKSRRDEEEEQVADDSERDSDLDIEDDDEIMKVLRAKRMAEIRAEGLKKEGERQRGHGIYREIKEAEFLPTVTKSDKAIVHFFHGDYPRCKIVDKHLSILARTHPETKFVSLNAEKAGFFVEKLQVIMLPTIVLFKKGVAGDRIVGFDDLGGRDDFETRVLEKRLARCKIIDREEGDEEDELEAMLLAEKQWNPIREALRD